MNIAVVTGRVLDPQSLPGLRFSRAFAPSTDYRAARVALLTGQYPQRHPLTRFASLIDDVTDDFSHSGIPIIERAAIDGTLIAEALASKRAVFFVGPPEGQEQITMSLHWPGVTDSNLPHTKISTTSWECSELVSSLDVAPTLAAIAGYDVRPNARLSFDGMNLTPVIRYGATGHGGLFFDDGTIITPTETRQDTSDPEWQMWKSIMEMGPLQ